MRTIQITETDYRRADRLDIARQSVDEYKADLLAEGKTDREAVLATREWLRYEAQLEREHRKENARAAVRRIHESELPPRWGPYARSLIEHGHRPRVLSVNNLKGTAKDFMASYRRTRDNVVAWAELTLGITMGHALIDTRSEADRKAGMAPAPRWARVWTDRYSGRLVRLVIDWQGEAPRRRYSPLYPNSRQCGQLAEHWADAEIALWNESESELPQHSMAAWIAAQALRSCESRHAACSACELVATWLYFPKVWGLPRARKIAAGLTSTEGSEAGTALVEALRSASDHIADQERRLAEDERSERAGLALMEGQL